MLAGGQLVGVTLPEVGVQPAPAVAGGKATPQQATGGIIARANGIRQYLAGAATQGKPHKANHTRQTTPSAGCNAAAQTTTSHPIPAPLAAVDAGPAAESAPGAAGCWLFFNHAVTVLRETPKMRVRPRRLLRSW